MSHIDAKVVFKAPQGLGCVGQEAAQQFSLPIGVEGGRLNVHFSTREIEIARQSHREFSLLAMLFGLLVSIGASYIGFRLIIGKPLKALLFAIQRSDGKSEPISVPVSGADELSTVIRAYNQMQTNLVREAERFREKSAELNAERHRNEALLSKVFQVSPYPFAILDAETGVYHNVNEAWLSTMGYSREQVIGKTARSLGIWVDAADRARFTGILGKLGSARAYEAKVQTRNGEQLDTLISGEYVECPGGARIFMVADDVTEMKAVEAERLRHHAAILDAKTELERTNRQLVQRTQQLEAAQDSLVQQERLATLGELTATVSHELRNPLAAIQSSVHLAIKKTEGLELGVDRSLERAERNVRRCDDIISDLLGYASEPVCQSQRIEADEWLQATISELDIPHGIELIANLSAQDTQIFVAPERIRQAVVNVFENATQVLADMQQDGIRKLTVRTSVQSGHYTIAFEDTGPGMDRETIARAFEPLFSTKSYGCGLGLATARKIVEKHDGTVHVESEVGAGTVVTMSLPVCRAHERAA